MGKTALALNIVQNVALRAHKQIGGEPPSVAFFSLEMSKNSWFTVCYVLRPVSDNQRLRVR